MLIGVSYQGRFWRLVIIGQNLKSRDLALQIPLVSCHFYGLPWLNSRTASATEG